MSATPAISVITPVYNSRDCLGRAAGSVLGQSFGDLEYIMVDDGSSDGSGELCDDWARRDPRVRVIHQPNAGVAAATNAALDAARGEYVAFLDHDDYLSDNFCGRLWQLARGHDAEICKGLRERHNADGTSNLDHWMNERIADSHSLLFFFGTWWTALYRRALLERYRIRLRRGLVLAHDLLFQNEAVLRCRRWATCDDAVYHWCYRQGSADMGSPTRNPEKIASVLFAYPAIVANTYRHQTALDIPGMCNICVQCAQRLLGNAAKAERREDALRCYAAAVALQESCPRECRSELHRFLSKSRLLPAPFKS